MRSLDRKRRFASRLLVRPAPAGVAEPLESRVLLAANLGPAVAGGFSDAIVISTVAATNADAGAIPNGSSVFVDFVIGNFGNAATGAFSNTLKLDGVVVHTANVSSLAAGNGALVQDVQLPAMSVGVHTLLMTADSGNAVAEDNEGDNTYERTFYYGTAVNGQIRGNKFSDRNSNGVKDGQDQGLQGWTIYADVNNSGTLDGGDLSGVSDANGNYVIANVPPGLFQVREVAQAGWAQTTPGASGRSNSNFKVTVVFPDSSLNAAQQAAFAAASSRWAQIITGDVPDVLSVGFFTDDVSIEATAAPIDGVGGILGQAGPRSLRPGSNLPVRGVMSFDSADLANLQSNGNLADVILHEMGHVLGHGSLWSTLGLITGAGGADPRFTGANAVARYQQVYNTAIASVPVENTGGAGTRDAHWRESVFQTELMTGFLSGATRPLSTITVASMQDLGYQVNYNAADAFTAPGPPALAAPAEPIGRIIPLEPPPALPRIGAASAALVPVPDQGPMPSVAQPNAFEVHVDPGEIVEDIHFGSHDIVAPTVTAASFVFLNAPQRVTMTFSEPLGSIVLSVVTVPGNQFITPTGFNYEHSTNTATSSFAGTLPDGNYRAIAEALGTIDLSGNYLAANYVMPFHVLQGDANRDRSVNVLDLGVLATFYGQTSGVDFSKADFNLDGQVNVLDLGILATQYGKSVAPPSLQALASSSSSPATSSRRLAAAPAQPASSAAAAATALPGAWARINDNPAGAADLLARRRRTAWAN